MAATLNLSPDFRSLVTDLAAMEMERRTEADVDIRARLSGWIESEGDRAAILRAGLERVLADCEYRDVYLDFLQNLQRRSRPLRHFPLLDDRRKDLVLEQGLAGLESGDLAVLAIDPVVLADVWDVISANFSSFWDQAVRRADELSARERNCRPLNARAIARKVMMSLFPDFLMDAKDPDCANEDPAGLVAGWSEPVPVANELALAPFGTGHEPSSSGPPPDALTWTDEIPFASMEILAVHDPKELELRQGLAVQVEYRWQPTGDHGSVLTVWLTGALILARAACTARLIDAQGVERARATVHEHALTFQIAAVDRSEVLTGWTIACEYRKEKFFDARFLAVLQPPGTGLALPEQLGVSPSSSRREVMSESHLEDQLLDKLQEFLLELGHGFCFEARQERILIGGTYGFIDLVFYHRILKCHVLIELKLQEFSHENIGQLNTYVSWYAKNMMADGENPPIGILLCTQKDHALAEYALAGMDNQLFVSKYQLHLPKREQLQRELERMLKEGS